MSGLASIMGDVSWWTIGLVGGGALVVLAGLGMLVMRLPRLAPAEQAFVLLALRLGLGRRQRDALRRAARVAGVQPVALVLSPSALEFASARWQMANPQAGDGTLMRDLRRRLFPAA